MASRGVIAKRYSRALLSSAKNVTEAAGWLEPLLALSAGVKASSELEKLLKSPAFSEENKWSVLSELAKKVNAPKELVDFLKVLISANRAELLVELVGTFKTALLEKQNTVEAVVESASELSAAQKTKVQEMIEKALKKKVIVTTALDASLLAGFKVKVAGLTMDASLKANIDSIHKKLLQADFAKKGIRAEA